MVPTEYSYDNRRPEPKSPSSGSMWAPVRVCATQQVFLAAVPDTIDGVALGPNRDRVLLAVQTDLTQMGIYQLVGSGSVTAYNLANQDLVLQGGFVMGRLYRVRCTGGAAAVGLNGVVAGPLADVSLLLDPPEGSSWIDEGFLTPTSPGTIVLGGLGAAGTIEIYSTTTLVRTPDADADADFAGGKTVNVEEGSNRGLWVMLENGNPTSISAPTFITFDRAGQRLEFPSGLPDAPPTSAPPVPVPLLVTFVDSSVGTVDPMSSAPSDEAPQYRPLGFRVPVTVGPQLITVGGLPVTILI